MFSRPFECDRRAEGDPGGQDRPAPGGLVERRPIPGNHSARVGFDGDEFDSACRTSRSEGAASEVGIRTGSRQRHGDRGAAAAVRREMWGVEHRSERSGGMVAHLQWRVYGLKPVVTGTTMMAWDPRRLAP